MFKVFTSKAKSFLQDTRGNVAMIFALSATALTTAVGGGLDYSRSAGIGTELQAALDSGVLAAASLTQTRSAEEVVRAYVEAALGDHAGVLESLTLTVNSDTSLNSREIGAEASVQVPTTLLGVAGIDHITVRRETQAVERARNIEISLVLDISSSMSGAKIDNLREAAIDFVDTMLTVDSADATSFSVIPYGGTVRLPDSFFRFVTDEDEHELSGFDWEVEVPGSASDWNGCLEMTRTQAGAISLTNGDHGVIPGFTVWNKKNGWCPNKAGTEAVFLTNDQSELNALISQFDNPILSDGTGTDIGTGWGVRALDPSWQGGLGGDSDFSDRPAAFDDEDTLKVLVVMTDGGITSQRRPDDEFEPLEDLSTLTHVGTKGTDNLYSRNQARDVFDGLCDHAKDNNVVVYTIAFQVGSGWKQDDMSACATSPAQFYNVEDLDIASAFSAIAADLSQLRLSR